MQNVFDGQTGAALYVTDDGSFDVLFLPEEQNFSGVQVVELNEGRATCCRSGELRPRGFIWATKRPIS
jgi:hypothetical protein